MTTLLSFLFVLGVLVFVHELGHFLVARWYGVRVITFSLGFGPKIIKFTRGGTEYCVSIIPLGGYVKMAGETRPDERTGAPDEFLSKSKWIRFQVYLAGPVMNVLLAIIASAVVLSQGADVPAFENAPPVLGSVADDGPGAAAGLRVGDKVVAVDGRRVLTWEAFEMEVLPRAGREIVISIERAGSPLDVRVTPKAFGRYEAGELGVLPVMRPQISLVNPGSPAARAGLQEDDVILAVGGERGIAQDKIIERIRASANAPLAFVVERAGVEREVSVTPEGAVGSAIIGVSITPLELRRVDPSGIEAIALSFEQNWENSKLIGRTLRGLFTADTPVRQLMGPVAIAEMSGTAAERGWQPLLALMAMISLNLGLLNLMPVPVLDGGQIAILLIEGVARRDLSIRVKERIFLAGAAAIVLLMVTVFYNDIARILR
jgi:regulator of sigma E protease